jgi:hypothetical protein
MIRRVRRPRISRADSEVCVSSVLSALNPGYDFCNF